MIGDRLDEREFMSAWRAGARAWGGIVPLDVLREVAAKRARAWAKRREFPSAREYAKAALVWGRVFMDAWFGAGYDHGEEGLDALDAGRFEVWP
jgi:hypothetical protein